MVSVLPQLDYLDDIKIMDIQQKMVRAHATTYAVNGKPNHFEDLYSIATNIHKCDDERNRRYGKNGSNIPKLMPIRNNSKANRL